MGGTINTVLMALASGAAAKTAQKAKTAHRMRVRMRHFDLISLLLSQTAARKAAETVRNPLRYAKLGFLRHF
jgi:hypothetical protein